MAEQNDDNNVHKSSDSAISDQLSIDQVDLKLNSLTFGPAASSSSGAVSKKSETKSKGKEKQAKNPKFPTIKVQHQDQSNWVRTEKPLKHSGSRNVRKGNQRLSSSDPSWESSQLWKSHSSSFTRGTAYPFGHSTSSSSSQSSGRARYLSKTDRLRRNSDSCPGEGFVQPYGLRVQHAAHRCAWSGSESGSTASPHGSGSHPSQEDAFSPPGSGAAASSPSTPGNSKRSKGSSLSDRTQSSSKKVNRLTRRETKFEGYIPLCALQQGLKKGEFIEGVLRINPRNYEDAYISAPDNQMDIYIGGILDRNRALQGDIVAVQVKPPEEWKILWDVLQGYQDRQGLQLSEDDLVNGCAQQDTIQLKDEFPEVGQWSDPGEQDGDIDTNWWGSDSNLRQPDTLEILGLEAFEQQIIEYQLKNKKNNSRRNRLRNRVKEVGKNPFKDDNHQSCAVPPHELFEEPFAPGYNVKGSDSLLCSVQDKNGITATEIVIAVDPDAVTNGVVTGTDCNGSSTQMHHGAYLSSTSVQSAHVAVISEAFSASDSPCSDCDQSALNRDSEATELHRVLDVQLAGKTAEDSAWTTGIGSVSPGLIVSPEQLLDLGGPPLSEPSMLVTSGVKVTEWSEGDDSDDSVGRAVPPDDMSEDEYTDSFSGESTCSHQLEQALEDAVFLACQQDAQNNNFGSMPYHEVYQPFEPVVLPGVDFSSTLPIAVVHISNGEENHSGLSSVELDNSELVRTDISFFPTMDPVDSNQLEDESSSPVPAKCNDFTENGVTFQSTCSANSVRENNIPSENVSLPNASVALASVENFADDTLIAENKRKRKKRKRSKKKKSMTDQPLESIENKTDVERRPMPSSSKSKKSSKPQELNQEQNKTHQKSTKEKKASSPPSELPKSSPTPNKRHLAGREKCLKTEMKVSDVIKLPGWEKFVQKTGKVVYIIEKKHSRAASGYIKVQADKNPNWALFSPTDHRLPRMIIPILECPRGFLERPHDFAKTLFIARIKDWPDDSSFAIGTLCRSLGSAGEIEPETEAILEVYNVDNSDFPEDSIEELHIEDNWSVPEEEVARRRDFRKECVFTIDPSTARDLDDALSCQRMDDGTYEVGVHIADVTYFLQDGTKLDEIASQRATSTYLVQMVVPMLPRILCEKLCSLNPGEDKLTFSVVWKITAEGEILEEWCGQSIICSCVKLSYDHAQDMIENPEKEWKETDLPTISGDYTAADVTDSIGHLQQLAVALRKRRFEEGALRLDQIQLSFTLIPETGMPSGFSIYEHRDSNRLVEEFMLLANMAVAHRLYTAYPDLAFLRRHRSPNKKLMQDLKETCTAMGIFLDISSAGALQSSLQFYEGNDIISKARTMVLTNLCAKPMVTAEYFCSGIGISPEAFRHYALNVPLYTHFTSPIRRYADIIVHRLLAASLGYRELPKMKPEEMQKQATRCNDRKMNAKTVHEMSCDLFLSIFIKECGPLDEQAMVMGVMDHSFDVIVLRVGVAKRVYCDKLPLKDIVYDKNRGIPQLTLVWEEEQDNQGNLLCPEWEQVITVFSLVDVVLSAAPTEPLRINTVMKRPTKK